MNLEEILKKFGGFLKSLGMTDEQLNALDEHQMREKVMTLTGMINKSAADGLTTDPESPKEDKKEGKEEMGDMMKAFQEKVTKDIADLTALVKSLADSAIKPEALTEITTRIDGIAKEVEGLPRKTDLDLVQAETKRMSDTYSALRDVVVSKADAINKSAKGDGDLTDDMKKKIEEDKKHEQGFTSALNGKPGSRWMVDSK